jgi:SAM-dependent methyltransferase
MQTIHTLGINTYLELGPHPVLVTMGCLCLPEAGILWLPSLRRGQADWESMLDTLGQLYLHGYEVDWIGFERDYALARRRVALPTYPFERQRHWIEPQPLAHFTSMSAADPVPRAQVNTLHALRTHIAPIFSTHLAKGGPTQRRATNSALEALCLAYIVSAWNDLGMNWQIGERWTLMQLANRFAVVPQHHRLLARMCTMLAESGILRQDSESWVVLHAPSATMPEHVVATFPPGLAQAELVLLTHCGAKLSDVLRGREDPLTVLFPGGDSSMVSRFYQDTDDARLMNHLAGQAMQWIVARSTMARPLRVMEIGAGTGGTTGCVLPHLSPGQTKYTFTDVGRSFLTRAQKNFSPYGFVEYRTLDIENDPVQQGFAAPHYDVIIAANVLHATADLRQTMEHVRCLLEPDGLLLLRETTRRAPLLDLTFGLTEGWWRFRDLTLRPHHALLSSRQWRDLLRQTGFQAVTCLPAETMEDAGLDETFFIAQADSNALTISATAFSATERAAAPVQAATTLTDPPRRHANNHSPAARRHATTVDDLAIPRNVMGWNSSTRLRSSP